MNTLSKLALGMMGRLRPEPSKALPCRTLRSRHRK
jgi:hypothetical protein